MDGKALEPSNFSQELCFVWGAPLSGQRRWMLRSAELTKPDTDLSLLFAEPDTELESLLADLETEMKRPKTASHRHIYIEFPAALLQEDFELDAWLGQRLDWHASFAGIVSEEAHLLNSYYRELYEEFSRSSQSAVILARSHEGREEMPIWIEDKLIDFGKRVEVFEDDLWPRASVHASVDGLQHRGVKTLTEYPEEYDAFEMPVALQDFAKVEVLFRQMLQGDFGTLWGAEALRIAGPEAGAEVEVVGISLTPHAIFEWRSKVKARCLGLSQQISLFNVVGAGLEKNNLTQSLRALQLLVDS
ncbi:MAG: hypothetical protein ABIR96_10175 [Bdellovibrionota bacterium]